MKTITASPLTRQKTKIPVFVKLRDGFGNEEMHTLYASHGENVMNLIARNFRISTKTNELGTWITSLQGHNIAISENAYGGLQGYCNDGLPYVLVDGRAMFLSLQNIIVTDTFELRLQYDPYLNDIDKPIKHDMSTACISCALPFDDSMRRNIDLVYSFDQVYLMTSQETDKNYESALQPNWKTVSEADLLAKFTFGNVNSSDVASQPSSQSWPSVKNNSLESLSRNHDSSIGYDSFHVAPQLGLGYDSSYVAPQGPFNHTTKKNSLGSLGRNHDLSHEYDSFHVASQLGLGYDSSYVAPQYNLLHYLRLWPLSLKTATSARAGLFNLERQIMLGTITEKVFKSCRKNNVLGAGIKLGLDNAYRQSMIRLPSIEFGILGLLGQLDTTKKLKTKKDEMLKGTGRIISGHVLANAMRLGKRTGRMTSERVLANAIRVGGVPSRKSEDIFSIMLAFDRRRRVISSRLKSVISKISTWRILTASLKKMLKRS